MTTRLDRAPSIAAHAVSADEVMRAWHVDPSTGLHEGEAHHRQHLGRNILREIKPVSVWWLLAEQLRSLIIWLLAGAAALSYAFGDWVEATAIALVILINTLIGWITEIRGVRSMEALRKMASRKTKVRRSGTLREVPATEIVLGDIVVVEGGDVITADVRLLESADIRADESALTGESVPVTKSVEVLGPRTPLADRSNMLFKGTSITSGSGVGVVTAVGMQSELGRISALVDEAEDETTPLEKQLARLARHLVWITLVLIVVISGFGILAGREWLLMVEMAVALAVASFPEGLPMVTTVALARGMWRMAQRNVLVERLAAVETLGSTTIICTDKTGTLTENRMTVTRYELPSGPVDVAPAAPFFRGLSDAVVAADRPDLIEALEVGVLCANAELQDDSDWTLGGVGDPMELGLIVAAAKAGIRQHELIEIDEELREEAFSTETYMMATFNAVRGGVHVSVKGAPEAVIQTCTRVWTPEGPTPLDEAARAAWLERNTALAERGLRVLGLASRMADSADDPAYEDLCLVGLVGMQDPPRSDVGPAIDACRRAGIRPVMVTGDHVGTARAVAESIHLGGDGPLVVREGASIREDEDLSRVHVLARVTPEQKLRLVERYQGMGEVVAMTGDGVNDAPALKKANIGVAMGLRGTQVAKEAADMVIRDDRFESIVDAVRQGRTIFLGIRRFVVYLLSCNLSEILCVGIAALTHLPLPLLPLQILFLNLITDVFPALALGIGEGDRSVMDMPPRDPRHNMIDGRRWAQILLYAAVIAGATLGSLVVGLEVLGLPERAAGTLSFVTLAFAQTWHVLNMRSAGAPIWKNDVLSNRHIWWATVVCVLATLAAVYIPATASVMELDAPDRVGWGVVIGFSLVPLFAQPIVNGLMRLAASARTQS